MSDSGECPGCGDEYASLWQHYKYYPDHAPDDMKTCRECGRSFKSLGGHWNKGSCEYPDITDHQMNVAKGILMGDGYIESENGWKPALRCKMVTGEYLQYLDNEVFPYLGNGVKEGSEDDIYVWRTVSHPGFNNLLSWYDSGEKVWPSNISLNRKVLKHWFCGDGHYDEGSNRVEIGVTNERENKEKVESLFDETPVSVLSWSEYESEDGYYASKIRFSATETDTFFEFIGEPLSEFEYKWPEEYRYL